MGQANRGEKKPDLSHEDLLDFDPEATDSDDEPLSDLEDKE